MEKSKQNGWLNQASGKRANASRIGDAIFCGYKSVSRTVVAQIQSRIRQATFSPNGISTIDMTATEWRSPSFV